MHLIFGIRGIKQQVDLTLMFLQAQMFKWQRQPLLKDEKGNFIINPDGIFSRGNPVFTKVQGSLRPLQFYEYVFPKEALPEVLAMLRIHDKFNTVMPAMKPVRYILKKIMGGRNIPDLPELKGKEGWQITDKYIPLDGVGIHPVCIKDDVTQDYPDFGFYQEGL